MNLKSKPIGVFDSGIGGLSVLKQFIRFLPFEKYVYLGDTARVPYGNKSPETVIRYALECADFLIKKDVKLIVAACNTASAVALEEVEKAVDVPVIGMIYPAARAALRASRNGTVGIIGTRATINSGAYPAKIKELALDKEIATVSQACPLFVPIVEEGWTDKTAARLIAEEYLKPIIDRKADTLVLGCTHYPALDRLLTELLPGTALIDSGEHAAVSAIRLLAEKKELADEKVAFVEKPDVEFYVTDVPSTFFDIAKQFLGFPVDSPITTIL